MGAVARMLPKSVPSGGIDDLACASKLGKIFGNGSWKELYYTDPQKNLFGDEQLIRDQGDEEILRIYTCKLKALFGNRFPNLSKRLMNSKNSPLFEFIFCVGNPNGIGLATRAAKHIIENM